jgi:hypothetical protein
MFNCVVFVERIELSEVYMRFSRLGFVSLDDEMPLPREGWARAAAQA